MDIFKSSDIELKDDNFEPIIFADNSGYNNNFENTSTNCKLDLENFENKYIENFENEDNNNIENFTNPLGCPMVFGDRMVIENKSKVLKLEEKVILHLEKKKNIHYNLLYFHLIHQM